MSAAHTPTTKRTRLRAVYLTNLERDLVIGALTTLKQECGAIGLDNRAALFAKSFTCRRIDEVLALFKDRAVVNADGATS